MKKITTFLLGIGMGLMTLGGILLKLFFKNLPQQKPSSPKKVKEIYQKTLNQRGPELKSSVGKEPTYKENTKELKDEKITDDIIVFDKPVPVSELHSDGTPKPLSDREP